MCTEIVLNVKNNFCTQHVLSVFWAWNYHVLNNLLSYCGLVDAKIRASDKGLPVWPSNKTCLVHNVSFHKVGTMCSIILLDFVWLAMVHAWLPVTPVSEPAWAWFQSSNPLFIQIKFEIMNMIYISLEFVTCALLK